MIYILIGNSCSGKSTARQYIEKKYSVPGFEVSDFIRKTGARFPNLTIAQIFSKLGTTFVAKEIAEIIKENPVAVISGFRSIEEIHYIKQIGDCTTIGIYSSSKECFKRSLNRKRTDYPKNFFDFYKNTICTEYSMGLADIFLKGVDYFFDNDKKNIVELYDFLDSVIKKQIKLK